MLLSSRAGLGFEPSLTLNTFALNLRPTASCYSYTGMASSQHSVSGTWEVLS